MESSGNEMAYFMAGLGILAFIVSFFIDKIDFANHKREHRN